VGNGKFNPDGEMTYAEFSQVVARANKAETGATDGYWAGKAVDYCRNHTYIKDLGAIIPANYDVPVPREVAVAGAYRMSSQFIKTKDASITEKNIPDYYAIDEAYRNEILLSYQSGLSRGADDKGTFNPKDTLTRAELCQLLYNAGFTVK
ncbi:MAG: S-layer homology domain-containing protein, partial [Clostridia bacterium]|nr:S-layer homology domain-containing protein [Clostridia bacterium]